MSGLRPQCIPVNIKRILRCLNDASEPYGAWYEARYMRKEDRYLLASHGPLGDCWTWFPTLGALGSEMVRLARKLGVDPIAKGSPDVIGLVKRGR